MAETSGSNMTDRTEEDRQKTDPLTLAEKPYAGRSRKGKHKQGKESDRKRFYEILKRVSDPLVPQPDEESSET